MQKLPAAGERKGKKMSGWELGGEGPLASPQGKMGLGRKGGRSGLSEEEELVLPLLRDGLAVSESLGG